jgi:hypothetical protein
LNEELLMRNSISFFRNRCKHALNSQTFKHSRLLSLTLIGIRWDSTRNSKTHWPCHWFYSPSKVCHELKFFLQNCLTFFPYVTDCCAFYFYWVKYFAHEIAFGTNLKYLENAIFSLFKIDLH